MKATSQKLKKFKVKQVYGFKKDNFSNIGLNETTTVTTIQIVGNK
ncbi:hypothetical protein [Mucilaginibacter sp.]